jgi:hypothetical protein
VDADFGPLSVVREQARDAFLRRNLALYLDVFTEDLEYKQPGGKVIGREQLGRDVRRQFRAFSSIDYLCWARQSIEQDGDVVVEVVKQEARATIRAFLFIIRRYEVLRTSKLWWVQRPSGWRIRRVEVLDEIVKVNGRLLR